MDDRVGESTTQAYDRGVVAGSIEARLTAHDHHFREINGSITHLADEIRDGTANFTRQVNDLKMLIQRVIDQAAASDATEVAKAVTLKNADEARRSVSEQRWSPWARGGALIGTLYLLLATYLALRGLT